MRKFDLEQYLVVVSSMLRSSLERMNFDIAENDIGGIQVLVLVDCAQICWDIVAVCPV